MEENRQEFKKSQSKEDTQQDKDQDPQESVEIFTPKITHKAHSCKHYWIYVDTMEDGSKEYKCKHCPNGITLKGQEVKNGKVRTGNN